MTRHELVGVGDVYVLHNVFIEPKWSRRATGSGEEGWGGRDSLHGNNKLTVLAMESQ